jgi:hypothetical protein
MWRLIVSLPVLDSLPGFVERLTEDGASIQEIVSECGVVTAEVVGDRAESLARSLAFSTDDSRASVRVQ